MTVHYLDTSAWVKFYYVEKGTPWVRRLTSDAELIQAAAAEGFVVTNPEAAGNAPANP
jgi:predicted nucleic acid-binding protein